MSQKADVNGGGNVIVQIVGDGNRVETGHPHLRLTRYPNRRVRDGEARSEAELLRPYARSIELIGRETVLSDFRDWFGNGDAISVRVLVGPAGRGKTRLALELCEQAAGQGWRAGFLTRRELERFQDKQNAADWGWNAPTLVVVDYAASDAARLNDWLTELSDHAAVGDAEAGEKRPLRLLLLERHADPQSFGGWWHAAFGHGDGDAGAIARLLDCPEPITLPAIEGDAERRLVIAAMLEQAGSELRPPEPGEDAHFDTQLAELTWGGEPLFLMMAALLASQQGFAAVLGLARDDLALAVAERELTRIGRTAKSHGVPEDFARHMAALATLCQGLGDDDILDVIGREKDALGHDSIDRALVNTVMAEALPRPEGGIEAVEPDMVGEAVLLLAWGGNDGGQGLPVLHRALQDARAAAVPVVIRTCQDYAIHGHAAPLAWLDALGEDAASDLPLLLGLIDELPDQTVELRERAVRFTKVALKAFRNYLKGGEEELEKAGLTAVLNNLSNRLNAVGRREDALAAIEEAVAIRRALAASRPDAFRRDLASSLNNLSNRLDAVGRREDALAAIEEAMELYRALAVSHPDAFRPDLAMSLNNLSNHLDAVGRREDALAAIEEAVGLYRSLAVSRPDAFRPDLAMSLNNLSNHLDAVDRREDALAAIEEAVGLYRALAVSCPDAFRPDLAMSLNNLSNSLNAVGRCDEALAAIEEAVGLYRALAVSRPDAFRPDLASSLNNLSGRLDAVGRCDEALAAIEEAVGLYRALAASRPDTFRPDLALSLNNLSVCLDAVGRCDEALAAIEEAVSIRRTLAASRPDAFRPDLAMSLNNLSGRLDAVGRCDEALAAIEEAVSIRRALAASRPDTFRPDLATSCGAKGAILANQERHVDAMMSFAGGLRTLTPNLLALPQAFAQLSLGLMRGYIESAMEAEQEPDMALLTPIIDKLEETSAIELPDDDASPADDNTGGP